MGFIIFAILLLFFGVVITVRLEDKACNDRKNKLHSLSKRITALRANKDITLEQKDIELKKLEDELSKI